MDLPTVNLREPFPPYRVRGVVEPNDLVYGFMINDGTATRFDVSRADPNAAEMFALGSRITVERVDGLHLWDGFITTAQHRLESSVTTLTCKDLHGSLFSRARTAKAWPEQVAASGALIQRVFAEANARGEPPLLCAPPSAGDGPVVPYTPRAESIADFLRTMVEFAGWEWEIVTEIERLGIGSRLRWTEKLGRDLSFGTTFEQGVHFTAATLTEEADAFLSSALAVGGTGVFSSRDAAQANVEGRGDSSIDGYPSGQPAPSSPALAGTRVIVDQQVTGSAAMRAAALRQHDTPEYVREALTLTLYEGDDADGITSVDMSVIGLGNWYRLRFDDLAMGQTYDRRARLIAYSINAGSGAIDCVFDVERAASYA